MTSPTTDTPRSGPVVPDGLVTIDLPVEGMTCASCAARIERKLGRMPGVRASVNYATGSAHVEYPAGLDPHELVATIERTGYGARLPEPETVHEDDGQPAEVATLRRRLVVSAALSLPVVLLSMVEPLHVRGWGWVALALAAPVVGWGGWPFHRAAAVNARHGASTMDTLVSLGVLAATGWSLYALLVPSSGADLYLEVAAVVTTFLLAGRWAEARARRSSGAALRALLELGAKEVSVLRPVPGADDGSTREVRIPVSRLAVGEEFLARPGDTVATDAVVVRGNGSVDTSLLTGEPVPVEVGPGDDVTGGFVNASGLLVLRATRVGADTQLARIGRLVTAAQTGKAPVQRLADRVSAVFVPVVLALSALTLVAWLLAGGTPSQAVAAAVAVLVIACPCALGLATPTALLVGTGRGAQLGLLIRGPEVLESTRRADVVVLDKTGTVTTGRMRVTGVRVPPGESAEHVLLLAGAVESGSTHPIARAVVEAARAVRPDLPEPAEFVATQGFGVQGCVVLDGRRSAVTVTQPPRDLAFDLQAAITAARQAGRTAVVVGVDGRAAGVVEVADTPRPEAARAVADLTSLGLRPVLLTGDHERAARAVAAQVGIDEVVAGVLPEGKVDVVRRLQAEGHVVAMVGDGVNDAAALAAADLGIAMGTGTDVAIEAADLTLVRDDLTAAPDAVRLSRATLRTIRANLFWAFAYNVAAIPLAAFGLLNPMVSGAAMAFSSVFVVTNSLRLRRFTPSS